MAGVVGRVLCELKLIHSVTKSLCGFCAQRQTYDNPSLAKSIGRSMKQCAVIVKGKGLEEWNTLKEERATKFVTLMELRWNVNVSHHAERTLRQKKRNTVQLLPLTEDIATFSKYLQNKATECMNKLETGCQGAMELTEIWRQLNAVLLTQVILFNRKRQGEVSRMTLTDYERRMEKGHSEDIVQCLSQHEQSLLKCLTVVEIEGKRGRTVPVLLTASMKKCVSVLSSTRSQIGVCEQNMYLFPRVHFLSEGHVRGSDCLRELTEECKELRMPELLRSTNLRKQIGTMSQIVNLQDNELDVLADFLGHDVRIHREFF